MYHRIIILARLFLRKASLSFFPLFLMTFSDALPLQFWRENCATFNEHIPSGVHKRCFLAPWQCDDEIKIQFTDEPSQDYSLLIFNEEGEQTDAIDIDEISPGLYQLAFIPSENSPGFCEEKIQLKIQSNAGQQGTPAPDLDTWVNAGGAGDPWTTGATPSINTSGGLGTTSEIIYADYAFIPGLEYRIKVNFSAANNSVGSFGVLILNGSNVTQFSNSTTGFNSGAAESDLLIFTATADTTRIGISLTSGVGANTFTITGVTLTRQVGTNTIVAKTDYLDLKIEHPDTILVNYSNHRNFAGLNYESSSPDNDFNIRVPAVFYHERFPEEDEVEELSSSLLTLNTQQRTQRKLDTDYLPYYFHKKLQLIIKHQNVSVYDRQWIRQEAYQIDEGERRWPLKKAACWLTEKESINRNIL